MKRHEVIQLCDDYCRTRVLLLQGTELHDEIIKERGINPQTELLLKHTNNQIDKLIKIRDGIIDFLHKGELT